MLCVAEKCVQQLRVLSYPNFFCALLSGEKTEFSRLQFYAKNGMFKEFACYFAYTLSFHWLGGFIDKPNEKIINLIANRDATKLFILALSPPKAHDPNEFFVGLKTRVYSNLIHCEDFVEISRNKTLGSRPNDTRMQNITGAKKFVVSRLD